MISLPIYTSGKHNRTITDNRNAAAFIKFLVLKMRRLFEGCVCSRAALIANFVKTTVNLWFI